MADQLESTGLFAEGRRVRLAGDHERAIPLLRAALAAAPADAAIRVELAEALFDANAFSEAEQMFRGIVAAAPSYLIAHIRLGFCARARGDRLAAACHFFTAGAVDPRHVGVRMEMAADFLAENRIGQAEAAFAAVLALSPAHGPALVGLGGCRRRRGDRAGALAHYDAAAAAEPDNIWARLEAAAELIELNRPDEADARCHEVLTVVPGQPQAHLSLGHSARRRGDRQTAHEHFMAAAKAEPDNVFAQLEAAADLREMRRYGEARAVIDTCAAAHPNSPWVSIGLGLLARAQGDRIAALDFLQRAVAADPDNLPARTELASQQQMNGDPEAALSSLAHVLAATADSQYALTLKGLAERALGQHEAARATFRRAHECYPLHSQTLVELAVTERRLGRDDVCIAALKQALAVDPGCVAAVVQMAEMALTAQDAATAYQLYADALERQPGSLDLQLGVARARAALGQIDAGLAGLAAFAEEAGRLPDIAATSASLLRDMGSWREGLALARAARRDTPGHFALWREHIHLELGLGTDEEVQACLASCPAYTTTETVQLLQLSGWFAERRSALDEALALYLEGAALAPENAGLFFDLTRLHLMRLDLDAARAALTRFCQLNAPAARLQGKGTNISQTHFGQLLDDYALDHEAMTALRAAAAVTPPGRVPALLRFAAKNPDNTAAAVTALLALRQEGYLAPGKATGTAIIPETIVQYWNEQSPPADVTALIESWRNGNASYTHVLFDDAAAKGFLRRHFVPAVLNAYLRVRQMAQKADVFRLAFLFINGGVYADADDRCVAPLAEVLPRGSTLVVYQEDFGTVANNFIAVAPRHPVIFLALEKAVAAINRGDEDMLWLATGPGLLTRAFAVWLGAAGSWESRLRETAVLDRRALFQAVAIHCNVGYKRTDRHWGNTIFGARAKVEPVGKATPTQTGS